MTRKLTEAEALLRRALDDANPSLADDIRRFLGELG